MGCFDFPHFYSLILTNIHSGQNRFWLGFQGWTWAEGIKINYYLRLILCAALSSCWFQRTFLVSRTLFFYLIWTRNWLSYLQNVFYVGRKHCANLMGLFCTLRKDENQWKDSYRTARLTRKDQHFVTPVNNIGSNNIGSTDSRDAREWKKASDWN